MKNKIFCQNICFASSYIPHSAVRSHLQDFAPEWNTVMCVTAIQHTLIMLVLANTITNANCSCLVLLILRSKPAEKDSRLHANGAHCTANDMINPTLYI